MLCPLGASKGILAHDTNKCGWLPFRITTDQGVFGNFGNYSGLGLPVWKLRPRFLLGSLVSWIVEGYQITEPMICRISDPDLVG